MNEKARNIVRWIMEIFFLFLFIRLAYAHKLQLWFGIFMVGVLASLVVGRYYCGWVCPMNTLFRPIGWLYRKLNIKRLESPKLPSGDWLRYLVLLLFLSAMVLMRVLHARVDVLLYIVLASVAVTAFFKEDFWHRHLCPFGTILSLSSRKARLSMRIEESGCVGCGACQRECPSGSIMTRADGKRFNRKSECLLCYRCVASCPTRICRIG